jgi:hypothetical protein
MHKVKQTLDCAAGIWRWRVRVDIVWNLHMSNVAKNSSTRQVWGLVSSVLR